MMTPCKGHNALQHFNWMVGGYEKHMNLWCGQGSLSRSVRAPDRGAGRFPCNTTPVMRSWHQRDGPVNIFPSSFIGQCFPQLGVLVLWGPVQDRQQQYRLCVAFDSRQAPTQADKHIKTQSTAFRIRFVMTQTKHFNWLTRHFRHAPCFTIPAKSGDRVTTRNGAFVARRCNVTP
jgi:hypothetical protein